MAEQLQLRRGTLAQIAAATPAQGEVWPVTDTGKTKLVVGDGATLGGIPMAREDGLAPPNMGYAASRFYHTRGTFGAGTVVVSANVLYAVPITIGDFFTFLGLGLVLTAGVAASNAHFGIYARTPGSDKPGALVLDTGAVATTGTGNVQATISQALNPGRLWLACLFDHTPTVRSVTDSALSDLVALGSDIADPTDATHSFMGFSVSQTYGALPNPFPASPTYKLGSALPRMHLAT